MSADVEVVKVHGHIFTAAKVRGFEVMCIEDGRVNLKSLCEMAGSRPFKELYKSKTVRDSVVAAEKSKVASDGTWKCEYSTGERIRSPVEISEMNFESIRDIVFHVEKGGDTRTKEARVAGTYGPRYLVDYLIMLENPAYLILVHELLEAIDKLSQVQNTTMESTIEDVTETLKAHVAELEEELKVKDTIIAAKDKANGMLLQHLHDCSSKKLSLKKRLNETETEKGSLELKLDVAISKIDEQSKKIDMQTKKIDDLTTSHRDLKSAIIESTKSVNKFIADNLPAEKITTGTTEEVLYVYYNKDFDEAIREEVHMKHKKNSNYPDIEDDEVVLESVCCQEEDFEKNLKKHHDPEIDIFYGVINNSLDLFHNFTARTDGIARCLNMKQRVVRKIVAKKDRLRQLSQLLQQYADSSKTIRTGLISMINGSNQIILNHICRQIGEVKEKLDTVITNQQTIVEMLEQLHPGAKSVWYNHAYRTIIKQGNKVFCKVVKNSDELYELTSRDLKKLKFKQ